MNIETSLGLKSYTKSFVSLQLRYTLIYRESNGTFGISFSLRINQFINIMWWVDYKSWDYTDLKRLFEVSNITWNRLFLQRYTNIYKKLTHTRTRGHTHKYTHMYVCRHTRTQAHTHLW